MKIYYPLKPTYISQHFGENKACINGAGRVVTKIGNTCPQGYYDFYKSINIKGHNGTDLGAYHNQPIYFNVLAYDDLGNEVEWVVHEVDNDDYSGRGLVIKSKKPVNSHIGYLKHVGKEAEDLWANQAGSIHMKLTYWHNKKNVVRKGQKITFGQKIAYADNTGASSGDHVHFSAKLCTERGRTLDKNNGYRGAVDIERLLVKTPVTDFLDKKEELTDEQQLDRTIFYLRKIVHDFRTALQLERIKNLIQSI